METNTQGAIALLALSHTPVEQALYEVLRSATGGDVSSVGSLSLRRLLELTGLGSYTTLRRARAGLVAKLSIDCKRVAADDGGEEQVGSFYLVYGPEEIFERRRAAGLDPFPKEYRSHARAVGFVPALERVVSGYDLSRREAQVALCCAEGLTNAEIGDRLCITEQTVKFHMRHLFIKFGVRRRGELISRLLRHEDGAVRPNGHPR
ncbi:MAG TPA: helix-turn-helix transcriptional regulator [Pyrinomonadaceae bacterium]